MKATVISEFGKIMTIKDVPEPTPSDNGVVLRVMATGLCRSDWHAWMGHDSGVILPHIPGHEIAGIIEGKGKDVIRWNVGDRVTLPFVCGCGYCPQCTSGNHHVCIRQCQPGFTHWGSFAEYVAIEYADTNLVMLPDEMDFVTAASLGCRFTTSFRGIVDQAKVSAGQWVAIHGCGGVGLSAIMIANAVGANVIAIDIDKEKLNFSKKIGAVETINASITKNISDKVIDITKGGADISIDALGSQNTCYNSIENLRIRGKHIQIGLMLAEHSTPEIPMGKVIAKELEILGSHGMQAHRYPVMLKMIQRGKLNPQKLIGKTISLEDAPTELAEMNNFSGTGVTVIDKL